MLHTKDGKIINVQPLSGKELIALLKPMLPSLTMILDAISLDKFTFYKASYPFGGQIIKDGKCYLPLVDGGSIEFNDSRLPDSLIRDLSYNSVTEDPLGVIINKTSELYLPIGSIIMSHAMLQPGDWFGIPRAVDSLNAVSAPSVSSLQWYLNAGARYIFTLTKATSKSKHLRLQKSAGVKLECPARSEEQWSIFVEIARAAKSGWASEIIFFPREFINRLKEAAWSLLNNKFSEIRRSGYNIWHNTNLVWDASYNALVHTKKLSHFSDYALSTVRQLFTIAANSAPGFVPATTEDAAPIKILQDAYTNIYGITEENHSNIIMHPANFTLEDKLPVYYSLNYPTLARYNPDSFKGKSLITLLDEVERITKIYQQNIDNVIPRVASLFEAITNNNFTFYHSQSDGATYPDILNAAKILETDSRFTMKQKRNIVAHNPFFTGCIKIQHKL